VVYVVFCNEGLVSANVQIGVSKMMKISVHQTGCHLSILITVLKELNPYWHELHVCVTYLSHDSTADINRLDTNCLIFMKLFMFITPLEVFQSGILIPLQTIQSML
jgi:hypothetical protein